MISFLLKNRNVFAIIPVSVAILCVSLTANLFAEDQPVIKTEKIKTVETAPVTKVPVKKAPGEKEATKKEAKPKEPPKPVAKPKVIKKKIDLKKIQKQMQNKLKKHIHKPGKKKAPKGAPKGIARIAGFRDWTTAVRWSPDSQTLAIGTYESIRFWSLKEKKEIRKIKIRSGYVRSLTFSADGKTLFAGSYQMIEQYDVATGKRLRKLKGHRGYVTEMELIAEGQKLVSSCDDLTVRVWDLTDAAKDKPEIMKATFDLPACGISVTPDGTQAAVALGDKDIVSLEGEVVLIDLKTGETVKKFSKHARQTIDVQLTSDGKTLLSSSMDERINVHNVESGEATGFFGGHARPVQAIYIHPGDQLAITVSGGRFQKKNEVKGWSIATGEEFFTVENHRAQITAIAVSPNGKHFATSSYDKTVLVYDAEAAIKKGLAGIRKDEAEAKKKEAKQKAAE